MTSALQMAFIVEATASSTRRPAPWQRSYSPMLPRRLDSRSREGLWFSCRRTAARQNSASPGEWNTRGSTPPMTGNVAIDRRRVRSRSSRQRIRIRTSSAGRNAAVPHAAVALAPLRPNTANREGWLVEYNFGIQLGTDSAGQVANRLRVALSYAGDVITAFPY